MSRALQDIHRLMNSGRVREAMLEATTNLLMAQMRGEENHPSCGEMLDVLGTMHRTLGNFDAALDFHQRALFVDQKNFGPNHPNVGSTLGNIAGALTEQGRFAEAEPLFQRSLRIMETAIGPDHSDLAVHCYNVGGALQNLGRPLEAEPFHRRAALIAKTNFGPTNHLLGQILVSLGFVLESQGKDEDAVDELTEGLAIVSLMLNNDHPLIKRGHTQLVALLRKAGREEEACLIEKKFAS